MKTDLVVIGAGATGLAAAVTAAEGGAKVILFEKQRSMGGSSNFFEGTFAVESEIQREQYVTYSRDDAFKGIMEYSHWRADARLVRAFVNESAATLHWLRQIGVEFTEVVNNMPNAPRTYHVVKGCGEAVVKTLATKAKELGVVIRLGAPVKRILSTAKGVAGVIAEIDGEETEVTAKAVVVASGGYANNKEWIRKYSGFDLEGSIVAVGNTDKTGDGIRMAWEVGAAEAGLGPLEMYRVGPLGHEFPMKGHVQIVAVQPDLWVDPRGERFCDEGISFYDTSVGNANARFKGGFTYSLFDESIKEQVVQKGIDRNFGWDNLPGTRPVNFDEQLKAALDRGTTEAFVADSVEELAGKMGIDPLVLKATVDEYNRFCEKGHDDLFAKEPKYLRPLKGPKFYAVKARTIFLGTLGGIKINHCMEVVDKKGRVIPGLYAGGYDAGGMWGDSYPITVASGASSAFAINSGRIAGRNGAKFISP